MLAFVRFANSVHEGSGDEKTKFANARKFFDNGFAGGLLQCGLIGGDGAKGVLGSILSY